MDSQIQSLQISMAEFRRDIDYLKQGQKKNDEQHEQIMDKIDQTNKTMNNFINSANDNFVRAADHKETMRLFGKTIAELDKKFAPKIVWDILCWAGGIAGALLITGIIYLLVDAFIHLNR